MAAGVAIGAVVGRRKARLAILLETLTAIVAGAAGIDHAADTGEVTRLERGHRLADANDLADDLMAGDTGINGVRPFVPGLVQIRMADAAVEDFNIDIGLSRIPALEGEGRERGRGGLGSKAGAGEHACHFRQVGKPSVRGTGGAAAQYMMGNSQHRRAAPALAEGDAASGLIVSVFTWPGAAGRCPGAPASSPDIPSAKR